MKKTLSKFLPWFLAGVLQIAPMLRTVLMQAREIAPCAWAVVLRIGAGAIGVFGFDAVSSASSIAITPPTATNGVPYLGTITYSGSHAGSVSSMSISNQCMSQIGSQFNFLQGLKISYNGVNQAIVQGTPTNLTAKTTVTYPFALGIYDGICGGLSDSRSTSLTIAPTNAALAPPSFTAPPQSLTAQQGADVLFSAGAYGNPTPGYTWYLGLPIPANVVGTGSTLARPSVGFANAGLYTVIATNSQGSATSTAYLSVCQTAGNNPLAFHYTNYWTVSNALTLTAYLTNVPSGSNTYKWTYNLGTILSDFSTANTNFTLPGNSITANKSGTFSVVLNSTVGANTIVNQQEYDSYWAFGVPPKITSSPTDVSTNVGTTVVLPVSVTVQQNAYTTNLSQQYTWYKNGSEVFSESITGTNVNTSYTIGGATASDSGTYTVVISNYWGSVTSSPAVVTISSPPAISSQPAPKSVLVGQNASFTVSASGAPSPTFQWNKGSSPLSDGGVYSGTQTSTLSLTGVTASQAGNYTVTISNSAGSTNSNPATLIVGTPPSLGISFANSTISATTVPNLTYIVQSTPSLTAPIQWTPVLTNITDGSGLLSYTNSPTNSQQFLRILFP